MSFLMLPFVLVGKTFPAEEAEASEKEEKASANAKVSWSISL